HRRGPPLLPTRVTSVDQKLSAPTPGENKPLAPPVAKKPPYLTSTLPTATSASLTVGHKTGEEAAGVGASKPPLPIRSLTAAGSVSVGGSPGAPVSVPKKPAVPPKPASVTATGSWASPVKKAPPAVPSKNAGAAVDLLDSLDGDGNGNGDVVGWETL